MAGENSNLGSVMESMFKGMDYFFGSKTVVGEAIRVDNSTFVLPLVNVSFGLGGGANLKGDTDRCFGGGGMGASLTPSAVLVIQDGSARIINIQEQDKLIHMIEGLPDTVKRVMTALQKNKKVDKAVEEAFDEADV